MGASALSRIASAAQGFDSAAWLGAAAKGRPHSAQQASMLSCSMGAGRGFATG